MKQTAVECLKINLDKELKSRGVSVNWDTYLRMEKEQIVEAYYQIGKDHQDMIFPIEKNAEQYYKETYKSE